jgi:hypothetical protein
MSAASSLFDHVMLQALAEKIIDGVNRKSASSCSRWAELYRKINDPKTKELKNLSHRYHPWTKELRDCLQSWCSPKAAQMGITEVGLDVALFNIDVRHKSVVYFLPKRTPDATDFSKDRFNTAIDMSEHLKALFDDVNNVGLKRAGTASLYIRGTWTKSAVKSIPAPLVIFDEYDEMKMSNIKQAEMRTSGQFEKQIIKYSTPTAPKRGIDLAYASSTQEHFMFKCPVCGKWSELVFPDDIVIYADSLTDIKNLRRTHYRCHESGCALFHETKSSWLTTDPRQCKWQSTVNSDSDIRGFHINQFYSFTATPKEIAETAIQAQDDPAIEQEYHNSVGGKAHIPSGAGVKYEEILACIGNHKIGPYPLGSGHVTMGVDQGKKIWFEIDEWFLPETLGPDLNTRTFAHNLAHGYVNEFEELDKLMWEYQINMCVIDKFPERRKAEDFARRFIGCVWMCHYPKGVNGKSIYKNEAELTVQVDRTSWLDQALSRFHKGTIGLPKNTMTSYKSHIMSLVKRYEFDNEGQVTSRYINTGMDHLGHCRNYAEVALPLMISQRTNENIERFL